jgi:hypothetical protein
VPLPVTRYPDTAFTMHKFQFAPWTSDIELPFFAALASLKINYDRLDDSARKVLGLYEIKPTDRPEMSGRLQVQGSALTTDEYVRPNRSRSAREHHELT